MYQCTTIVITLNSCFKINFYFLDNEKSTLIFEDEEIEIRTIIMNHRIACSGFLFSEKPGFRKLIKEKLKEYDIPVDVFQDLKIGKDFTTPDGRVIPNLEITTDPRPPRVYAFCSDTCYSEKIIPFIKNINLLYHESTFLSDKEARAIETFHSTAAQAGLIAKKANVKRLIIGHFSARYKNLYPLLEEARTIFRDTTLAIEGDTFKFEYD